MCPAMSPQFSQEATVGWMSTQAGQMAMRLAHSGFALRCDEALGRLVRRHMVGATLRYGRFLPKFPSSTSSWRTRRTQHGVTIGDCAVRFQADAGVEGPKLSEGRGARPSQPASSRASALGGSILAQSLDLRKIARALLLELLGRLGRHRGRGVRPCVWEIVSEQACNMWQSNVQQPQPASWMALALEGCVALRGQNIRGVYERRSPFVLWCSAGVCSRVLFVL